MKLKKILAFVLIGTMLCTSMSFSAIAENTGEQIVYSYLDESGETINITQNDLDEGHWNKDALGDVAPYIYEEFPMRVDRYVDDYSDLSLEMQYMKKLDNGDSATLAITDMGTGDIIYSEALTSEAISVSVNVNKVYKITINEVIGGESKEYSKIAVTLIDKAEMPEYVANENTQSENTILVGKLDDLRASEYIDENGDTVIDGTMHRYDKVTASDFCDFCNNLDENNIYRIYTKDENEKRYTGFLSTYDNDVNYIYIPTVSLYDIDDYSVITPNRILAPITASDINSSYQRDISMYRDYSFAITDTSAASSRFKVFKMTDLGSEGTQPLYNIQLHTTCPFTMETWVDIGSTGNPVHCSTYSTRQTSLNQNAVMTVTPDGETDEYDLTIDDTLYYVIYFHEDSTGRGVISVQQETFYTDDVTGSAYEAYNDPNSLETRDDTYFFITDWRDVDVFYIKYTSSTPQDYTLYLLNPSNTADNIVNTADRCIKTLEIATKTAGTGFNVSSSPDDVFDLTKGKAKRYRTSISNSNPTFMYVYNSVSETQRNMTTPYRISYTKDD